MYSICMSLHNYRMPFERKLKAVESYLQSKQSLRKIASEFGVPYKTLWFWVRLYKEGGSVNLIERKSHKKRLSKNMEKEVMYLKEHDPALTIQEARLLLRKKDLHISHTGIWQIWGRYGLSKRPLDDPLSPFGRTTPESEDGIKKARFLLETDNHKAAAKIVNSLPSLPEDPVLKEIPEKFLSPRRRLERLQLEFGEIEFSELTRKARHIGKILERKGYIYSSIFANFLELYALFAIGHTREMLAITFHLSTKINQVKEKTLKFFFYLVQASMFSSLLQMNKALCSMKKCRRLLRHLPYYYYWEEFGTLLTNIGKNQEAQTYFEKALGEQKNLQIIKRLSLSIAIYGYCMSGEYLEGEKMLYRTKDLKDVKRYGTIYSLVNAHVRFGQGNLSDARESYLESLNKAAKEEFLNRIFGASIGLASVARAQNNYPEARISLQKYIPFMEKHQLLYETVIMKSLSGSLRTISEVAKKRPPLCMLAFLLRANQTVRIGDYRKAFNFARKQGLLGLFHRWIVFFPEPVLHLLEKGKPTGLPKAILKFPVFNQKIAVYHVKFLGRFVVFKNQQYLKIRLSPKEKAFLIHVAFESDEPEKFISLNDFYRIFWPRNVKPTSLLLHLLVRLKKKLMLPGHLLGISSKYIEPRLVNHGIYFTTDYTELQTLLAQAKALERAGEWGFAKKEFLRAFNLFRGKPFKKMYDQWSEDMRHRILTQLETEAINFAKSCVEHGNKRDAKKVLEKTLMIIPNSDEIKKISDDLKL